MLLKSTNTKLTACRQRTFSSRRARMVAAESSAQGDLLAAALLLVGSSRGDRPPLPCDQGLRLILT